MSLISIDPGLNGGICLISNYITLTRMPTRTIVDKPARTVFAKDASGHKVMIKSGPNKGQYKRIIKTQAKSHKELDCSSIYNMMSRCTTLIVETPAMSFGNSAKSTASTNRNYGKLLAIAELVGLDIHTVPPHKWKKDLDLGRDKSVAIAFAESLLEQSTLPSNQVTFTLAEDGMAEALCIAYHYNKEILCQNNS